MTQLFLSPELSEAFRALLDRAAGCNLDAAKQATLEAVLRPTGWRRGPGSAGFEDTCAAGATRRTDPRELQALVET